MGRLGRALLVVVAALAVIFGRARERDYLAAEGHSEDTHGRPWAGAILLAALGANCLVLACWLAWIALAVRDVPPPPEHPQDDFADAESDLILLFDDSAMDWFDDDTGTEDRFRLRVVVTMHLEMPSLPPPLGRCPATVDVTVASEWETLEGDTFYPELRRGDDQDAALVLDGRLSPSWVSEVDKGDSEDHVRKVEVLPRWSVITYDGDSIREPDNTRFYAPFFQFEAAWVRDRGAGTCWVRVPREVAVGLDGVSEPFPAHEHAEALSEVSLRQHWGGGYVLQDDAVGAVVMQDSDVESDASVPPPDDGLHAWRLNPALEDQQIESGPFGPSPIQEWAVVSSEWRQPFRDGALLWSGVLLSLWVEMWILAGGWRRRRQH